MKKLTKSLSSFKVSEKTYDNMKQAIKKYNEKNLMPFSLNEFRRLAYEILSQIILQNKELPVKIR